MKLQLVILMLAALAASAQKPEVLLEEARKKETVDGDLKSAIVLYEKAAASAGSNRSLAARALVRLGACYEKMGDREARRAYERVISAYADQPEAAEARSRLTRLGGASDSGQVRTRLLWDNAIDLWGTVSKDGRYLSYVDWPSCGLGVRDLVAGVNRVLIDLGGCEKAQAEVEASTVSPDGKRIAFEIRRFGTRSPGDYVPEGRAQVEVIDMDGSNRRVILQGNGLDYASASSWSPDMKWVAGGYVRRTQPNDPGTDGIFMVAVDTGQVKWFKVHENLWPDEVLISPDGNWLAYSVRVPGSTPRLFVRGSADPGSPEILLHSNASLLAWTPSGDGLVLSRTRSGQGEIFLLPFRDGQAAGPEALVPGTPATGGAAGMTANGTLIFKSSNRRVDAVVLPWNPENLASSVPLNLTPANTGVNWMLGSGATHFSRDGKRLFTVTPENTIRIREVQSGSERAITPLMRSWNKVKWSHDGSALLVLGTGLEGKTGVFRIDDSTGGAALVTEIPGDTWSFAPSADGRVLYYGTPKVTKARDLASGSDRTLFEVPQGGNYDLRVSHDGTRLAIRAGIYLALVELKTGESRVLYRTPELSSERLWGMDWTSDDRELATIVRPGSGMERMQMKIFPVSGGEPRVITIPKELRSLSFSPDGKQVATLRMFDQWQVWALENFLPTRTAAAR